MQWLDFFDALVVPTSPFTPTANYAALPDSAHTAVTLNPAYALDGTHMNPSYLHLLEGCLNTTSATARK